MITTTGGFAINEIENGVELLQNGKVITSYKIHQCKNGKWRVRLYGASFGYEIEYYLSPDKTYGYVFNGCVTDLNSMIDMYLMKAGA